MATASTEVDAPMHVQGIALPSLFLLFAPARGAPPGAKRANGAMVQAENRQASPAHERPDDARRSAWMAAAQAGDQAAYGALLRDCVGVIERIARRQGVPADRVDDVVQDTLLTIHRARQTYDPSRSFTAWLAVLAERRAIDLLRKTGRHGVREVHEPIAYERHADESAAVPGPSIEPEVSRRLGEAVADLPLRQREAVQMLVLQERSLAETAAATGRSIGSLKVNLHRALKSLRARLGPVD
jgi:RNA polymerase sigma factor (sigma-70 family)